MFRRSSIDKIVGKATEEEKLEVLGYTDERFNDQAVESLIGKEREKTPEELEMLALADEVTSATLRYYGLQEFHVPAKNVHIVSNEAYAELFGEDTDGGAQYFSTAQDVIATGEQTGIQFLKKMIHELFHFKSFQALKVVNEKDFKIHQYRTGFRMHSRKENPMFYLERLDEAVNEEMTIRALNHVLDDPRLAAELARIRAMVDPNSEQSDEEFRKLFSFGYDAEPSPVPEEYRVWGYTYKREREAYHLLINKLFERNPGQFDDTEELFDLFEHTKLSGSLLPVGRLIDETFGKGTFRKLGETETDEDFYAAIAAL